MVYHPAHDAYFENQVLTATPQKLRWMAIDGAIRFARQAVEHWRQERIYEGGEAVIGCQRLLIELMSAVKPERAPDLAGHVTGLYAYISRLLNDARRTRDPKKLAEVIEILEIERETWRQVCEQLGAAPQAGDAEQPRRNSIQRAASTQRRSLARAPSLRTAWGASKPGLPSRASRPARSMKSRPSILPPSVFILPSVS